MNKKYKLRKDCPFGKKGDIIDSYAWFIADEKPIEGMYRGKQFKIKTFNELPEYFEEVKGVLRRLRSINSVHDTDYGSAFEVFSQERFRTEEEAQAKLDLINHIYKLDEPVVGDCIFNMIDDEFTGYEFELYDEDYYGDNLWDFAQYHAGIIMNKNTTEDDRAERIRLLKKVYA